MPVPTIGPASVPIPPNMMLAAMRNERSAGKFPCAMPVSVCTQMIPASAAGTEEKT